MDEEPKDRLKRARLAAQLTLEELSGRVGRALTTVRAHENGQNGIKPAAARRYGEELGVDPSWILFGQGIGPSSAKELENNVSQAMISGNIHRGVWIEVSDTWKPRGFTPVYIPQYKHFDVFWFQNLEPDIQYRVGEWIFAILGDGVSLESGDEIIAGRFRDDFFGEVWLWTLVGEGEDQILRCVSTSFPGETTWEVFYKEMGGTILGVVVGGLWMRDLRSFKPVMF